MKHPSANAIPAPSIDIAMIHMNVSYTTVSKLVDSLYDEIKFILGEQRTSDSLYGRMIRILTRVIAAVEQVSATQKLLSSMQKKDLAVAVTRTLIEKCLDGNADLIALYNVIIRDQIDEMIEMLIDVSRKVNTNDKKGNNGLRPKKNSSDSGCISLCLAICGVKRL
jgi:hypothetical protein